MSGPNLPRPTPAPAAAPPARITYSAPGDITVLVLPSYTRDTRNGGSTSPAGQSCLRQGEGAARDFRSVYAKIQAEWLRELAKVRTAATVREAYRGFAPCRARHRIPAVDEAGLFALADRRLAADRTDADLAVAYATPRGAQHRIRPVSDGIDDSVTK